MADKTKIEWAGATLNYANGCSVVSPGCTNCYAMKAGGRNLPGHPSTGLTRQVNGNHVWTGEIRLTERALQQALKWQRGRKIFWNAHGDLFHENVPDEAIDRLFAVCALTPQHTHMILTKRSARMREYFRGADGSHSLDSTGKPRFDWHRATHIASAYHWLIRGGGGPWPPPPARILPLPNVWLGVSVEDQTRADLRIPDLLATPAAVRFISAEPLLGPVDLRAFGFDVHHHPDNRMGDAVAAIARAARRHLSDGKIIDWVICGGESGPGARPMHPDWARSLRDQCAAAGVPFHFKQWGLRFPTGQTMADGRVWLGTYNGAPTTLNAAKSLAGRLLDGVEHNGAPA